LIDPRAVIDFYAQSNVTELKLHIGWQRMNDIFGKLYPQLPNCLLIE